MLFVVLKRALNRLLGLFGLEVRRKPSAPEQNSALSSRMSLAGALTQLSRLGLAPATVIDVGVASQTEELYRAFPHAKFLLIEPLAEFEPALQGLCKRYDAEYILAAAGETRGSAIINVHQSLDSSSLCREIEGPGEDGTPREVPLITIDEICGQRDLKPPYLIKVDVQGAELRVLAGATETLKQTAVVILEVSLFGTFVGGAQICDILKYMHDRGFVPYDTWGFLYRPYDGALAQMDFAFVPAHGAFRASQAFATPNQRKGRNE